MGTNEDMTKKYTQHFLVLQKINFLSFKLGYIHFIRYQPSFILS